MIEAKVKYVSTGGNRHSNAADWDSASGLLAYGADRNVALWFPLSNDRVGVGALLKGHTERVNAVKFLRRNPASAPLLISGSADKTVRLWKGSQGVHASLCVFETASVSVGHSSSVNCLAVADGCTIFASGAADATVKIWQIALTGSSDKAELLQTVLLQPRLFPLAIALSYAGSNSTLVLAVGGTRSFIQIYVSNASQDRANFAHQTTLAGHEGWVRSLSFVREGQNGSGDLLLASASQDKYIRLWRIHHREAHLAAIRPAHEPVLGAVGKSLSNKIHRFEAAGLKYSLTFEALLLGHEDWIYTASWNHDHNKIRLLSASADNTLAIWESDAGSGVWVCTTRLGEISAQKGSTTATGSTGGFYIGLWSPGGNSVVCLGRTGSWRLWHHHRDEDRWLPGLGLTGHVKAVKGIAWAKDGSYLLSTSSDQTTRLHAEWKRDTNRSWHEFARPQIHGYDLNCIDSVTPSRFISGADEKLLRVFDEPAGVAHMLEKLCGVTSKETRGMPEAANIPVLGLSNKAVETLEDDQSIADEDSDESEVADPASRARMSGLDTEQPPLEDQLARHTLWPEQEKLYGHGYEISAVAASNDGKLIATACKASSIDHAVIRLYETDGWREMKPALTAHSLTVTCLRFTADDKLLLSVGRDRQWTIFEKSADAQTFTLQAADPRGHSRMILGASWAPRIVRRAFATAARDKTVKIWSSQGKTFECSITIKALASVTCVEFYPRSVQNLFMLAFGSEDGVLTLQSLEEKSLASQAIFTLDSRYTSKLPITQLAWQPSLSSVSKEDINVDEETKEEMLLAMASEDSSLKILSVRISQ
ncbi:hypothetical protein MMC13_001468 [Lambiella insularis]|nr:hypothetical protein [Lambiella insularis]